MARKKRRLFQQRKSSLLREGDRQKGLRPFDFIIPLLAGSPFQGERREAQAPPLELAMLVRSTGYCTRYGLLKNEFCFARPLRLGAVVEF